MLIHARFSPELKENALEWIGKLSRYIVCEEVGGLTEKTHYHTCFESDVGLEAIKKRFQTQCKALGLVSKKGQENAYYGGVKPCTDPSYICKEGKFIATAGYSTVELEALQQEGKEKYCKQAMPITAQNITQEIVMIKPKKSVSMRAQFVRHLKEAGWKENYTIHLDYYHDKLEEMIDQLTDFWENAFTTPQGAVCIEHAKWVFADDNVREIIKLNNRAAIKKCLR